MLFKVLEAVAFMIGQIVLALRRWNCILTNGYATIFIPIYMALALRWLGRYLIMRQMKFDIVLRVISLPKQAGTRNWKEVRSYGRRGSGTIGIAGI